MTIWLPGNDPGFVQKAEPQKVDPWRWATVTQVSPLRIRLDGDVVPLDATPDNLTQMGEIAVGTRVWVQFHGKRLIVHGAVPATGMNLYTPILKDATSGATLSSSSATGYWYQTGPLIHVTGALTVGAAATGGSAVTLPTAAPTPSVRLFNCGTLINSGATVVADQSGVAYMTSNLETLVLVAPSNGFRNAAVSSTLRWSVVYF